MSASSIVVLQVNRFPEGAEDLLRKHFHVIGPSDLDRRASAVRAIVARGRGPVDEALLDRLPNLEFVSLLSAGMDGIDLTALERRKIPFANTSHALAGAVAEIGLALLLSSARRICEADRFVRAGQWDGRDFPLGRSLETMKVGILGLGAIGRALAVRLTPLVSEIGYHARSERPSADYRYFPVLAEMADWADAVVVTCPATAETRHLVGSDIIRWIGPEGYLVNIARGSVVDERALVDALHEDGIAGVGLDVYENEPAVPAALISDQRVTLLPHIGSGTQETKESMGIAMVDALVRHFGYKSGT